MSTETKRVVVAAPRGYCAGVDRAVVTVDGDEAVAVCESTLLLRRTTTYEPIRAGVSHFHLRRATGAPHGWQIVKRVTRLLDGTERPRRLLSDGIAGRLPA